MKHKLAYGEMQYAIKLSLYINKWQSYSQLLYITAAIFSAILEFVVGFVVKLLQLMFAVITHNSVKKRSLCINKWVCYSQL